MAVKPILFSTEMVRAILDKRKTVMRRVIKGADPDWSFTGLSNDIEIIGCDRYGMEYPKRVDGVWATFEGWNGYTDYPCFKAPYQPGDILYVRETWQFVPCTDCRADAACAEHPQTYETQACVYDGCYLYLADYPQVDAKKVYWHPSIHMPREAARIFLRVKNVRVERLQDSFFLTESPIFAFLAEGIDIGDDCRECIESYGNPCCIEAADEDGSIECGFLDDVRTEFSESWDRRIKPKDLEEYGWAANPWCFVTEFEQISKEEAMK